MSEEYTPQEVLTEIFTRLPIKSLLRCTSVCKSWYSLIKNPSFITTHLNSNTSPLLLLRHCTENYEEDRYSLHFDNDTLDLYSKLDCPFKSFTGYFKIVGYCHGLLCLSDCHIEPTFLWNPSIRVYVTLPKPSVTFGSHGPHTVVLGFGFDSLTNDYKVVRIVSIDSNGVRYSQEVEVYTLSTGAWRGIRASGSSVSCL
ncbi:hypothetical protein L1049_024770 [Liquidambar formosana]|uniref:F-box domain-containing protein n=1 Tax=Liquidambar formosana TaxID=63359 RepID=A0AAP0S2I7_LIQFO